MSDKIKVEDVKENEVTKQVLEKVDYGNFQELFKKLNIESVWRAGKKKVDMISQAIEALKIKKGLEQSGSKEEVIDIIKQNEEDRKTKESEQKVKSKSELRETIEKANLSQTQIKRNLGNIGRALNDNFQPHRKTLLEKKDILESLLEE